MAKQERHPMREPKKYLAPALVDRGVQLSYRALDARATALGEALGEASFGIGDRIATVTGNSSDQVVLFFACAKAGVVLVPLSRRLSPVELASHLTASRPALLLVEDEFVAGGCRLRPAGRWPASKYARRPRH
jgi:acyl-CoA synthetase (AMP-forming)/AMP-acid ligase II